MCNSRLDTAEEQSENKAMENIQAEAREVYFILFYFLSLKTEQSIRELWGTVKWPNIHATGVTEKETISKQIKT